MLDSLLLLTLVSFADEPRLCPAEFPNPVAEIKNEKELIRVCSRVEPSRGQDGWEASAIQVRRVRPKLKVLFESAAIDKVLISMPARNEILVKTSKNESLRYRVPEASKK